MLRLFKLVFIGVYLLCNVVLVSAVQKTESAIHNDISPPFWTSFPFRSPQCIKQSSLCYVVCSHESSILYILSIVYIVNPNQPIPPTPPINVKLI